MDDVALHGSSILRCEKCGMILVVTPEDLLRYSRTRWPRCCAEVMTLYPQVQVKDVGDQVTIHGKSSVTLSG